MLLFLEDTVHTLREIEATMQDIMKLAGHKPNTVATFAEATATLGRIVAVRASVTPVFLRICSWNESLAP